MYNENWERWCRISIIKYFKSNCRGNHLYVEGYERDTENVQDYYELRIDGPNTWRLGPIDFKLRFEINVLCVVGVGNVNRIHELTGLAQANLQENIGVYQYGNGVQDTQAFVGCLTRVKENNREYEQSSYFGLIKPGMQILQATVEAHYEIVLP